MKDHRRGRVGMGYQDEDAGKAPTETRSPCHTYGNLIMMRTLRVSVGIGPCFHRNHHEKHCEGRNNVLDPMFPYKDIVILGQFRRCVGPNNRNKSLSLCFQCFFHGNSDQCPQREVTVPEPSAIDRSRL
ncbi:hypothetical protein FIBSPDRAFT_426515 [Athelia psychrophila]|uniref:Uncharacterized protein n=1 Tax=Athelia psychrophila TaxID=1759441 RepID=A0A166MRL7_9AGAM|nr:hypothetical protein FIBSPDRAFT_426515 [Fibularhizoctonia sp. CBS 109695]